MQPAFTFVREWSNGRLGYVHIQSMGDGSFRTVYSDILGKYNNCDGIVIDTRFNGGGRLHEDIEILFSGQKYFTQVFGLGQSVLSLLKEKAGIDATLINPRYITGIDNELMEELKADHQLVITLEDGVLDGGFGEKIARYYGASDMKVLNYGAKKEFVDRYDIQELLRANHLTDELIVEDIRKIIG